MKPTCHEFLVWIAKETTPVIVCGQKKEKKKKRRVHEEINICKIDSNKYLMVELKNKRFIKKQTYVSLPMNGRPATLKLRSMGPAISK